MEIDKLYCTHCHAYTNHQCEYDTHERDSSQDYFVCMICGWYYTGFTGKYHPPEESKK